MTDITKIEAHLKKSNKIQQHYGNVGDFEPDTGGN